MHIRRMLFWSGIIGAMAGYLFGHEDLRKDLLKAHSVPDAAKAVGRTMRKDVKRIRAEIRTVAKQARREVEMQRAKSR